MYVCTCVGACEPQHVYGGQKKTCKSWFPFYYVSPEIYAYRLGLRSLYLLSLLIGPQNSLLKSS